MLLACAAPLSAADLPPEKVTVAKLPPPNPYRLFVSDLAIDHILDGKMMVVDGESLKYQGTVSTGAFALTRLSPDRKDIFIATTFYSRLTHGKRSDMLMVYDAQTLLPKQEYELPAKKAQALAYKGTIGVTPDGRFVIVQNATPASSISIVDRKAGKFVTEVPTPGCWIVLPAQSVNNRFTTICGDGTLLTITLDDAGKVKDQKRSPAMFDADKDPVFVSADNDGDRYYFVSFNGNVYSADLGGEVAKFDPSWPAVDEADKKESWRPGGYQPLAYHKESGKLYLAMHPNGKEGSHKNPAQEIWVFDVASKKRVERVPADNAIAITVSRGAAPKLFSVEPFKRTITAYDAGEHLTKKNSAEGFGEEPMLLETY